MRRRGFTLVELLVVIAIIALLMGILMPALSRVRQLAYRLTCGTNLAGVGKAMLIYAIAHQSDGQNVLFLDSHVEFAKRAFCSLEDDNIYTISNLTGKGAALGLQPTISGRTGVEPANRKDSLLLHDPDKWR